MPIESSNLLLREAERLNDFPDAGGAMTATEVVDGNINTLFPPLSQADAVHGEVVARKLFFHVDIATTEPFYGANMLIAEGPTEPNTAAILLHGEPFDERADAVERLMQAAVKGVLIRTAAGSDRVTYDDQFQGQARLLVQNGLTFTAGENLYLELDWETTDYVDGLEKGGEYIQIESIHNDGPYTRLMLTAPLSRDYPGSWNYVNNNNAVVTIYPAKLRRTHDNSGTVRYCGITKLAADAALGASQIEVLNSEVQALPMAGMTTTTVSGTPIVDALRAIPWELQRAEFVADGYDSAVGTVLTLAMLSAVADANIQPTAASAEGADAISLSLLAGGLQVQVQWGYASQITGLAHGLIRYAVAGGRNKSLSQADVTISGGFVSGITPPSGGLIRQSVVFGIDASTDIVTDNGSGSLVRMTNMGAITELVGSINYDTGAISTSSPLLADTKIGLFRYAYGINTAAATVGYGQTGSFSLPITVTAKRVSDNSTVTATITAGGVTGDAVGTVEAAAGRYVYRLLWASPVKAASHATGSSVTSTESIPIDPAAVGLDALRMPASGKLPIIRPGDWLTMHDSQQTALTNPVTAGATYTLPRTGLGLIQLYDNTGARIPFDRYTVDLAAGAVTMANPLVLTGYTQPLQAAHVKSENCLVQSVEDTTVTLAFPLKAAWPTNTKASTVLEFGDLEARVTNLFDQATWSNQWADEVIGSTVEGAALDVINHPIRVTNAGCRTERWALKFISAGTVQVIGEHVGMVKNAGVDWSIGSLINPINPVAGHPYWEIDWEAWGGGFPVGSVIRFNTIGADPALWCFRFFQPGGTIGDDKITLMPRGDR